MKNVESSIEIQTLYAITCSSDCVNKYKEMDNIESSKVIRTLHAITWSGDRVNKSLEMENVDLASKFELGMLSYDLAIE